MLALLETGFVQIETDSEPEKVYSLSDGSWFFCGGYIANLQSLLKNELLAEVKPPAQFLAHTLQKSTPLETAGRIAGTASWLFWDNPQACLWIVPDRLGLTPIYYAQTNQGWLFSDSVESILDATRQTAPNPTALLSAVLGRHPLGDQTFYKEILQVQPGSLICIKDGRWQQQVYWQAELQPTLQLSDAKEYNQAYRDLLFEVVNQHLVPESTGITLSSGLDSSSLAAAMRARQPARPLTAFSYIAPELPSANEAEYVQEICRQLTIQPVFVRADHQWTFNDPDVYTRLRCAPLLTYYGETFQNIFKTAQESNVRVLMTGSGGDQLFGGRTPAYADLLLSGCWAELACQVRQHLPRSTFSSPWKHIPEHLIVRPLLRTYMPAFLRKTAPIPPFVAASCHEAARMILGQQTTMRKRGLPAVPGRQFRLEKFTHPVETRLLSHYDKIASGFHVELRHPLWDHRLIEFALSLPSDQIYHAGYAKWIVRRSLREQLPKQVLEMFSKIVPAAIAHRGLRERSIEKIKNLLVNMRLEELGIVNSVKLQEVYQDYLEGKTENTAFFLPVVVEAWLRRWF